MAQIFSPREPWDQLYGGSRTTEKSRASPFTRRPQRFRCVGALAVGHTCNVSIERAARALEEFKLSKMRLEVIKGIMGSVVISDVYNANPASMKASLQVLQSVAGQRRLRS
jgi:UDP-N-acetylmuramyl pentapeptide synthase